MVQLRPWLCSKRLVHPAISLPKGRARYRIVALARELLVHGLGKPRITTEAGFFFSLPHMAMLRDPIWCLYRTMVCCSIAPGLRVQFSATQLLSLFPAVGSGQACLSTVGSCLLLEPYFLSGGWGHTSWNSGITPGSSDFVECQGSTHLSCTRHAPSPCPMALGPGALVSPLKVSPFSRCL